MKRTRKGVNARSKALQHLAKHRQALRAAGLRPIQIWLPDVRPKRFAAEAHRQSLAIARSPHEQDDQVFIDSISEWSDTP